MIMENGFDMYLVALKKRHSASFWSFVEYMACSVRFRDLSNIWSARYVPKNNPAKHSGNMLDILCHGGQQIFDFSEHGPSLVQHYNT